VNLIGTIEVTRQLLPYLRRSRRGRIVTMGSLAGKEGLANMAAYSAAGAVDEVAQLVVWLCSDACSFNTGAVFDMSGGRATY
jgi:NAD(P)-dependent dehydrogenase (short-subunit alcohol dehydrogenase family)